MGRNELCLSMHHGYLATKRQVMLLARDQLTTPTFLNWRAKKHLRSFVVVNGKFTTGLPSSVCVVGCAFIMAVGGNLLVCLSSRDVHNANSEIHKPTDDPICFPADNHS